jgi:rod shape-determining protein MreD
MQVFAPESFGFDTVLIPRFVMMIIICISIYLSRVQAVFYGLVFGFLHDIIYTDLIGVYLFSMAFTVYIIGMVKRFFYPNLLTSLFLALLGAGILDTMVYGLYAIINVVSLSFENFAYERLFPSLLLNGVIFVLMYYPLRKLLVEIKTLNDINS